MIYVDGVSFQNTRGSYSVVFWAKLKKKYTLVNVSQLKLNTQTTSKKCFSVLEYHITIYV